MLRWVEIRAHTGGGEAKVKYRNPFFHWLDNQILMIEDYSYAGTDFRGDPDIPLPVDAQWGDIGKKHAKTLIVFIFSCFIIFTNDDDT